MNSAIVAARFRLFYLDLNELFVLRFYCILRIGSAGIFVSFWLVTFFVCITICLSPLLQFFILTQQFLVLALILYLLYQQFFELKLGSY